MALCRCKEKHSPKGRKVDYVESKYPFGYPDDISSICGRKDCKNAGLIWLTEEELHYNNKGERIFSYASAVSKVKVK